MEFGQDVTENTLRVRICNLRKAEGLGSPTKVKASRVAKSSPPYPGIDGIDVNGRFPYENEVSKGSQRGRCSKSGMARVL
jgi:hypothetical protein